MKDRVFIFVILAITIFVSCEKELHYDGYSIEDVRKIKELLIDADCEKGIAVKKSSYHPYTGTMVSSDTYYCDEWEVNDTTIEEFYKGLGDVYSVNYNRKKKMVVLLCYYTYYYQGKGEVDMVYSFYTKSKH